MPFEHPFEDAGPQGEGDLDKITMHALESIKDKLAGRVFTFIDGSKVRVIEDRNFPGRALWSPTTSMFYVKDLTTGKSPVYSLGTLLTRSNEGTALIDEVLNDIPDESMRDRARVRIAELIHLNQ